MVLPPPPIHPGALPSPGLQGTNRRFCASDTLIIIRRISQRCCCVYSSHRTSGMSAAVYGPDDDGPQTWYRASKKRRGAAGTPRASKHTAQDPATQSTPAASAATSRGVQKDSPPEMGRAAASPPAPQKNSAVSCAASRALATVLVIAHPPCGALTGVHRCFCDGDADGSGDGCDDVWGIGLSTPRPSKCRGTLL